MLRRHTTPTLPSINNSQISALPPPEDLLSATGDGAAGADDAVAITDTELTLLELDCDLAMELAILDTDEVFEDATEEADDGGTLALLDAELKAALETELTLDDEPCSSESNTPLPSLSRYKVPFNTNPGNCSAVPKSQ